MKTYELTVRSEGNVIFQDVVESKFGKWVIKEEALSELSATQSDLATALSQLAEAREGLRVVTEINKEYMELAYLAVPAADGMQGGRGRMRLLIAERDSARAEVARLTKERDDWRTISDTQQEIHNRKAAALSTATARVGELSDAGGKLMEAIAQTFWTSFDGNEQVAATAESLREDASDVLADAFTAMGAAIQPLATRDGGTTEAQP